MTAQPTVPPQSACGKRIRRAPPDRLLRIDAVCEKTSYGKTVIYEWIAAGRFPRPVTGSLSGEGSVRWRESEVDRWIADLPTVG